jgi:CheY-like chemotaxis protein
MTTEKRILVVDDEPSIRETLALAFSHHGYSVQTATNAMESLETMHRTPAEVLFLDLNLPGMTGLELCREVRKHWPWTISVAVTGYASLYELVDCREAGFEDYFVKPVVLADLLEAAEQAFKRIQRWKAR